MARTKIKQHPLQLDLFQLKAEYPQEIVHNPGQVILAYIYSQENETIPYTMNANGILIYPQTEIELNYTGLYENTYHHFRFCTVDLNKEWYEIDQRLKVIIKF